VCKTVRIGRTGYGGGKAWRGGGEFEQGEKHGRVVRESDVETGELVSQLLTLCWAVHPSRKTEKTWVGKRNSMRDCRNGGGKSNGRRENGMTGEKLKRRGWSGGEVGVRGSGWQFNNCLYGVGCRGGQKLTVGGMWVRGPEKDGMKRRLGLFWGA